MNKAVVVHSAFVFFKSKIKCSLVREIKTDHYLHLSARAMANFVTVSGASSATSTKLV